jgi:RNA polymerase sigma-70 factor (ECF subfamily)
MCRSIEPFKWSLSARVNDVVNQIGEENWHPSVYAQLRRIAERALQRENPGHSLQPSLLVNDAYLRLLEQRNISPDDRSAVMAAGATIIRRLLVDYARKRKSQKRGGEKGRGKGLHLSIADNANHLDVLELNDALEALGNQRPRAAQVVELKFFGGLTSEEIGEQIGVSLRTVKSDWRFAKAWLYRELGSDQNEFETL